MSQINQAAADLSQYAVLLLAGWTSGISLYLTVAILGISGRMGWMQLPGGLTVLQNPLIIALALILYAVEFVADKVPYVDSVWDSFHTFIRPAGAAAAGYFAGNEHGLVTQTALALLAGTFALDAHALKASTRLAINTSPEPFSNIAASAAEHSFVIFLFWFFTKHPLLAVLLVLFLFVISFFILKLLWTFVAPLFRKIFGHQPAVPPAADSAIMQKTEKEAS